MIHGYICINFATPLQPKKYEKFHVLLADLFRNRCISLKYSKINQVCLFFASYPIFHIKSEELGVYGTKEEQRSVLYIRGQLVILDAILNTLNAGLQHSTSLQADPNPEH